ncbi:MAG: glycerol-3-phosphate dehydrogenase [Chloroflexi bacterium]|nr:glycerol-3-phosphate dehydrogenase [Chloroflexota bacterium]|tara:strand:+ start:2542 stop:3543 length:1002 start_codon:yes stop_codon:yes gene_type:complete
MDQITIVGSTTWGTTLAIINSMEGKDVVLLVRTEKESNMLNKNRENKRFLPGIFLPETLKISSATQNVIPRTNLLLIAVPSQTLRQNIRAISTYIPDSTIIVSASKGLEASSGMRMSEIIKEEIPTRSSDNVCALSGPNLSNEILAGKPSSSVIASNNESTAKYAQSLLNCSHLRLYTNVDLVGVEICGALKNITAIAAGICDGLDLGDNAKASIITRGLAEMARFGNSLGAETSTFSGLAGMGDLIATCSSGLSRNNQVGRMLAKNIPLDKIRKNMDNVAEGIETTKAVVTISSKLNIDLPIINAVYKILFDEMSVENATKELMARMLTSEN